MLSLLAIAAFAGATVAQTPTSSAAPNFTTEAAGPGFTPPALTSYRFTYPDLPYQVNPYDVGRGPQFGYNICNSTTEGPNSDCQTSWLNSLSDFCLWSSPTPDNEVADFEAEAVAWCTQPTHGARLIPSGAITGVQFIRTPGYVQVTGHITLADININPNDDGGELDPHGDDEQGNPLGGLVFSNGFTDQTGIVQVIEWHNFMDGPIFCFKACDPSGPNAAELCQHTLDRIGCAYNAPAAYQDGVFESCLGDNQDPPGVYTGADGIVSTYSQPPESLGPIESVPYTPVIPATSSCTTYSSAQLFGGNSTSTSSTALSSSTSASTKASASGAKSSSSASSSATHSSAAGEGVKYSLGGVWTITVALLGALVGAVVIL